MNEEKYTQLLKDFTLHYHSMKMITTMMKEAGWNYPLATNSLYDPSDSSVQMSGDTGDRKMRFPSEYTVTDTARKKERFVIVNGVKFYDVLEFKSFDGEVEE